MSVHETVRPAGWPKPRGYSNGVMAGSGRLLAIAGQVAWDVECRIGSDRFADQFDQAIRNVAAVVKEAGGSPEHVVSLTIYVIDKDEYAAQARQVGERYRAVFGNHYPAMALVQVAALLEPGAKVEIQGLAIIPDRSLSTNS